MTAPLTTLATDSAMEALEGLDRDRLEALFRRRAERLAHPPATGARPGVPMLVATVGTARIAVRLTHLAEVMPLGHWTRVPGWPPALLGVTARRGNPLPVVDLHLLAGQAAPVAAGRAYLLLARCPDGPYGLRVDALGDVVHQDPTAMTPSTGSGIAEAMAADGLVLVDPGRLTAPGGPLARQRPG